MGIDVAIERAIELGDRERGEAARICGSDMCLGNNKLTFCNKYLMTLICKIASRSKIGLALTELGFPRIPELANFPALSFSFPFHTSYEFICRPEAQGRRRACNVLANPRPTILSAIPCPQYKIHIFLAILATVWPFCALSFMATAACRLAT